MGVVAYAVVAGVGRVAHVGVVAHVVAVAQEWPITACDGAHGRGPPVREDGLASYAIVSPFPPFLRPML